MSEPRRPDPVRQLLRALTRSAADAGCAVTLDHLEQSGWASATFTGARHRVAVVASDADALAAWLAMLPEAELPMRGCFVASCAAEITGPRATLDLLVLDD